MFRKETPRGQRDVLPAGKHASSGLRSVLRRLANVRPEDDRVRAELLRLVYAAAPAVLTANLANGALVVLVLWSVVPPRLLIGWYALLCAAVVVRTWLWRRHRRERPRPEQAARLGADRHDRVRLERYALGRGWCAVFCARLPDPRNRPGVRARRHGSRGGGRSCRAPAGFPCLSRTVGPALRPSARHRGRCRAPCDGGNGAAVRRLLAAAWLADARVLGQNHCLALRQR